MQTTEKIRLASVIANKIEDATLFKAGIYSPRELADIVRSVVEMAKDLAEISTIRPTKDWRAEDGKVLWWILPVQKTPFFGTPSDEEWSPEYTHWTKLPVPSF